MKIAKAALVNLVQLARADGHVSGEEEELIDRYRRALGLSASFARRVHGTRDLKPLCPTTYTEQRSERVHVLKMMLRVAHADGVVTEAEERVLTRFAEKLDIGPLELAEIRVEVENNLAHRRKLHRKHALVGGAVAMLGIVCWFAFYSLSSRADEVALEGRQNVTRLARHFEGNELRDVHTTFQEIEEVHEPAIVFLHRQYDLRRRGQRVRRRSSGTGFFVSPDGHIVTNKHVVKPWLFRAEDIALIERGWRVDPDTMFLGAWAAGMRVKKSATMFDVTTGWSSSDNTLQISMVTPDNLALMTRKLAGGRFLRARFHKLDETDLAVLKAAVQRSVPTVPIEIGEHTIRKLEPVMVLGFPAGISARESLAAETAPSLGVVRKVEKSIFIDAPIVPGNSGGPLFNIAGNVIGIADATYGASTVGGCIRVWHVLPLLPKASDLLRAARDAERSGDFAACLANLDLAVCRDADLAATAARIRAPILARCSAELRAAQQQLDAGKREDAKRELMAAITRYGRRFTKSAIRTLRSLDRRR